MKNILTIITANRKTLTLKSLTSGVCLSTSKNDEKKSDLSTCIGAIQTVSISAPNVIEIMAIVRNCVTMLDAKVQVNYT